MSFLRLAIGPAGAADPVEEDYSAELPRIPAVEPSDAPKTMIVKPEFKMELAAADDLVNSPVAVAWDERGRMFVVEMRGYSEHRDEGLSRIKMLVDDNDDGVYDRATIYADKLMWATAVACWDGGIFVGDAPDIWWFKDADGDGVAEIRKKVYTGFGVSNVQGLLNTFVWGLDNRIQGSASSTGGDITWTDAPAGSKPLNVRGRDFSFDPRSFEMRAETGGTQHGLSFDDWGRKYVCHNSDHAIACIAEDRWLARNPFYAAPAGRVSIATDGPQATIYRQSAVEPWRIVRTRLRSTGKAPGMLEGGGRAAGYFTSATGITIVRGDAFGEELRNMAIVGDVGSNVIHRKRLVQNGIEVDAERIDVESELVASKDIWFRPAQFANGPDGALYVCDVYREVIEHPASLPPQIKKHLDLNSGRDRGRIWRLAPTKFVHRKTPDLGAVTSEELVATLAHPNAWHRETASRLLYQRQDPAAVGPLKKLVDDRQANPLGRMHALYALAGMKKLSVSELITALEEESAQVRAHAARLAAAILMDADSPAASRLWLTAALEQRIETETDPMVRFQLAFAAGELPSDIRRKTLASIVAKDGGNAWMRMAAFSSMAGDAGALIVDVIGDPAKRNSPATKAALPGLVQQTAAKGDAQELAAAVAAIAALPDDEAPLAATLAADLNAALASRGRSLATIEPVAASQALAKRIAERSLKLATDRSLDAGIRAGALRGVPLGPFDAAKVALAAGLTAVEPREVVFASLAALDAYREPQVAELVLAAWPGLPPEARRRGGEMLIGRPERVEAVLTALEEKRLTSAELERSQLESLKNHANEAIKARALKLLASASEPKRQEVVDQYKSAVALGGDLGKGKAAFAKHCSACHKVENIGNEIGPNLAAMKNRGAEAILTNVLDPNREVNPQYLAYAATTLDGRTRTGLIAAESAGSLTLRKADGQAETLLRADLEELRSTGLSLMPEGLEKQIDRETMTDLLTYLMQAP